jgi:hypothetical protein
MAYFATHTHTHTHPGQRASVGIFEELILKISSDAFFRVFGRDTFFGSPQSLTWPPLDLRRGLRRVLNHSPGSLAGLSLSNVVG